MRRHFLHGLAIVGFTTCGCSLFGFGTTSNPPPPPQTATTPAPTTSTPSPPPAESDSNPAPPRPVHVTLRNGCPETVSVFFGKKPKFGSGTYSTLSSNSSTSKSFMPGDMVWIVDGGQNGIANATVDAQIRTIEVGPGCTSLISR